MTATPEPSATPSWSVDEGSRVVSAAAVGLLSAAIVISALYSRETRDLDWSNFTMGVLASVGLLGFAALSATRRPGTLRSSVVGWPAAAGSIGLVAMLAVLMDDGTSTTYVCSALLVALGVLVSRLTGDSASVLTALLGASIFYAQAFSDVFDSVDIGEGSGFKIAAGGVVVYVVAVTALGWFLPRTRVLTAVVAGGIGVAGLTAVLYIIFISRTFLAFTSLAPGIAFDEPGIPGGEIYSQDDPGFDRFREAIEDNPYSDDVIAVLIFAAILLLLWTFCAVVTGHVGFRVLSVAISVIIVPVSTAVLTVQHPTYWSVGLAGLGGILLLLLLGRAGATGSSDALAGKAAD